MQHFFYIACSEMPLLDIAMKEIQGFVDGVPSDDEPITVDELFRQSSSFTIICKQQQSKNLSRLLRTLFKTAAVISLVAGSCGAVGACCCWLNLSMRILLYWMSSFWNMSKNLVLLQPITPSLAPSNRFDHGTN